ncbi:MAG: hypothetical protein LBJ21_06775 [Acidobacteriota bacterium]|nr:hypothetical protein [Acidobacteriota bacterium]
MRLKIFLAGTVLILAMAITAAGADIAGTWVAEQQGQGQGQQAASPTTFNFTTNGNKLTGTIEGGRGGDAEIAEGSINGDEISFVVVRRVGDNEVRTLHRGKITGDEIKLTIERQGGGRMGPPDGAGPAGKPMGGPNPEGMRGPGGGQGGGRMNPPDGAGPAGKPMGGPGGGRGGGGPQELIIKRAP